MKNWFRKKGAALAITAAAVAGLTLTTTTPAQAFNMFTYLSNCPHVASYQQLVIRNYSGATVVVDAAVYPYNQFYRVALAQQGITYVPIYWYDVVMYRFNGQGNLNWYYHTDCFYR